MLFYALVFKENTTTGVKRTTAVTESKSQKHLKWFLQLVLFRCECILNCDDDFEVIATRKVKHANFSYLDQSQFLSEEEHNSSRHTLVEHTIALIGPIVVFCSVIISWLTSGTIFITISFMKLYLSLRFVHDVKYVPPKHSRTWSNISLSRRYVM